MLSKIKYFLILIGASIIAIFGFLKEYKRRIIAEHESEEKAEAIKDMFESNKNKEGINEVVKNLDDESVDHFCVGMQE